MRHWMKLAALLLVLVRLLVACRKERSVEWTLISTPRTGIVVQDDFIELVEGQAMGVRVVAKKKDDLKKGWSIEASSENPTVLGVDRSREEEDVFVFSGVSAGSTQIRFILEGMDEVFLDATVLPRDDWEPTVPPASFGGAGN